MRSEWDHSNTGCSDHAGICTTDRTYDNAVSLIRCSGAGFYRGGYQRCRQHSFRYRTDRRWADVTHENDRRERTQILMDIANKSGGMVIGTGDLSSLHLAGRLTTEITCSCMQSRIGAKDTGAPSGAALCGYPEETLTSVADVLDTPVSRELYRRKTEKFTRKTEDLVGPYDAHGIYLYHMSKVFSYAPAKAYQGLRKTGICWNSMTMQRYLNVG